MSLHHAAQHLAAQGRGPDTALVHMAPSEVRSLQTLAKAHGGSLTINPQTGLPEAGFLSSLLPTVIGAGLMAATGGAAGAAMPGLFGMGMPATIGLGVGGLEFARTGSLTKGLMAGLGAYGGAGLGAGLMGAGTAQATGAIGQSATAAGELAAKEAGAKFAADQAARQTALDQLGKQAMTPQAIESVAAQQAALLNPAPELSRSAFEQAAKESAVNAYMPTAAQKAALDSPMMTGIKGLTTEAGRKAVMDQMGGGSGLLRAGLSAIAPTAAETTKQPEIKTDNTPVDRMNYNAGVATPFPQPDVFGYDNLGQDFGRQQNYFPDAGFTTLVGQKRFAEGGYMGGGPVEQMSRANAVGMNTGYPQADITGHAYATPWQTPVSQNVVAGTADTGVNRMTGQMLATGGISDAHYNLGGYSDGGRLLRGPGDGVSDSIPATIGNRQPARLADGEFVVPARIVSELGNGSTEAGARKLYGMMDRVQKARGKTVGKGRVAKNTRADRFLPA